MKKQTFTGSINGKTFNDLDEFNNYLKSCDEVKSVSYSCNVDYVNESEEQDDSDNDPDDIYNKLYPIDFDPDQYVTEHPNDYWKNFEYVVDTYNKYLKEHKETIKGLSEEAITVHKENLQRMLSQTKEKLKLNSEATRTVTAKHKQLVNDLEKTKEQLQTLEVADRLFEIRKDAITNAINDIDSTSKKITRTEAEKTVNGLSKLLEQLFSPYF